MTINKITLSLAAMALATSAFAGTMDFPTGAKAVYNTTYVSAMGTDQAIGTYPKSVDLNTSSAINNKNVIYFKLDNANWSSDDTGYQIDYTDASSSNPATVNAASVNSDNELQFIVSGTVARDTNVTLSYNGSKDLNITMPSTTTGTVKITSRAKDNENDVVLAGAAASVDVATPITENITAQVNCDQVTIDSNNKDKFLAATPVTATTATCEVDTLQPASTGDIDFTYTDANVTIAMYPGNFVDGNFTSGNNGAVVGASDAVKGQTINMYGGDKNLSDGINSTLTYTLAGTGAQLADTTFKTAVTIEYPTDSATYTQTAHAKADSMTWTLPIFNATVLNMRENSANGVNTYIKLYNNDNTQAAPVDVTVTTTDGRTLTAKNIASVPANGSVTVSASDINSAITSEDLKNGYTAKISYENVAKTLGDAVATMVDAKGARGIRVQTNNKYNMALSGYKGL